MLIDLVPGPTETPGLKVVAPRDEDALLRQIASGLPFSVAGATPPVSMCCA